MPETLTRDFGPVEYSPGEVFDFPLGLPGFPECRRFLTVRPNPAEALVVLQSLDRVEVAFLTLPADVLAPGYQFRMVEADRRLVEADRRLEEASNWLVKTGGEVTSGAILHVLFLLSLPEQGPATANLLGPVVLNPMTRQGVQAIRDDWRYGAAEPLEALLAGGRQRGREAVCS